MHAVPQGPSRTCITGVDCGFYGTEGLENVGSPLEQDVILVQRDFCQVFPIIYYYTERLCQSFKAYLGNL